MTGSLQVVYTVHKFEAENIDEISINVGEKVIVLEKDEGFNDGWWQGRNIRGEIGLFPITYTVKHPPQQQLLHKIDSLENTISKMKVPSTTKPVEEWTSEQVASWLIEVGFDKQLADNFKDQEISGDILLELTLESLKELQVTTFGKRFKIHGAINTLKQESKNKKQTRVASPFPDLNTKMTTTTLQQQQQQALAISSYYNKQQPYLEDDLVSDYSSVIRNSRIVEPITTRPSIPLDMDLIASSPRLSTLVGSAVQLQRQQVSQVNQKVNQQQQASQQFSQQFSQQQASQQQEQECQSQLLQQKQQKRIQQLQQQQVNQQKQQQQQVNQQKQQQQQQQPHMSHQTPPSFINNEWKRNTMNNISTQEGEQVAPTPKASTSSRYSNFMRNSLTPNNKLQSILPNSNMTRKSEDVVLFQEISACPDMEGWLYKQGDKYKTWNKRWFVLKENNLFYFKSPKAGRMKGIINLKGYRIEVDESIHPGKYCFKVHHERERTFYFYTDYEKSMKDWLKTLMKATIARDFTTPVMSSSTIPTVSLEIARKMRPRPPSTIFHRKDHHFSLMTLEENTQPIMTFSQQQQQLSRTPSAMSTRPPRIMSPDNVSEYSTTTANRLKDSGFNSAHGVNITESSSSNSSTHKHPIHASPASVIFYPDEEDEDLIDPEHLTIMDSSQRGLLYRHEEEEEEEDLHYHTTMLKKQARYVDWVNALVKKQKITNITDLCTGEALLELLESTCHKEIMRPMTNPSQTNHVQRMDRIITAFKFMSLEGVELDGLCSIRDVLNGNEEKIMYMLDAIKYWCKSKQQHHHQLPKMASGGTFGEEYKLREFVEETESILPP